MQHGNGAPQQAGVTLIELMFTLAIVAVLLSISLPAMGSFMQESQSRASRNAMITSLNLARITAATRQSEMVMCPSIDHAHCDDSVWWQQGWIVFQDLNSDGKRSDDEPLLQSGDPQPGMAIASSAGRKHVNYHSDGTSPGTNLTITFCDARGPASAATLVVNNGGRVRSGVSTPAQATAACAGLQL